MDEQPQEQTSEVHTKSNEVSHVGLLIALCIILVAAVALAAYIVWQQALKAPVVPQQEMETPEPVSEMIPDRELTTEEKLEILNSLDANPDNLSLEERRAILSEVSGAPVIDGAAEAEVAQ